MYIVGFRFVSRHSGAHCHKEEVCASKKRAHNTAQQTGGEGVIHDGLGGDGDDAGKKATLLNGEQFLKNGVNPKVITLPEKLDPDDYIIKYGKDI